MNAQIISKKNNVLASVLAVLVITFGMFGIPHSAFAQEDYGYTGVSDSGGDYGSSDVSCCSSDYGVTGVSDSGGDYGYTGVSSDGTDYGYTGVSPDTTDYGVTGISADDYGVTGVSANDYGVTGVSPDSYDYSSGGGSYGGDYAMGGGSYTYSTPGYGSYAYSTPGLGGGYSSNIYSTPGYGYTTPVKTQTPVGYNTPTQTQVQTQTSSGQPIVINNNNNNVNTNTNNNTAPVAQVATTPVQHVVDYVYPTTPTYTTYRTPIVAAAMPAVSLSQIPYTGFDFGPVGDAIYWMGLLAFAVAAAYLLVYYRGGAFALASALIGGRSNIQPVQFTEADTETEIVTEAPVVEKVPVTNTRIASVISNLPTAAERHVTSDAMIVSHSKNGEVPRIVITRE